VLIAKASAALRARLFRRRALSSYCEGGGGGGEGLEVRLSTLAAARAPAAGRESLLEALALRVGEREAGE
jgi:hypothetical protein